MDTQDITDFLLRSYTFALPEERIAQQPAPERDGSRLMVLHRGSETTQTAQFCDILRYLPENCLVVANNSRVIPARLPGRRPGGGGAEFLLLTPLPLLEERPSTHPSFPGWQTARAEGLLRPAKKLRHGDMVRFDSAFALEVLEQQDFGRCVARLFWQGSLPDALGRVGVIPLPPYIKRPSQPAGASTSSEKAEATDKERYQTSYARKDKAGSAAAPTAGLHFTPRLCRALQDSGRHWAEVTLYVGYGTFSPVRCDDIREHAMHAEYVELLPETVAAIAKAKKEGRAVIAVGTTSCRVLEGVSSLLKEQGKLVSGEILRPYSGWIRHFLYPGRPFNVIDGLLTNFHLPGSSLLMLVSALAGRERILTAYQKAIEQGFRFFSYGDAMLIL